MDVLNYCAKSLSRVTIPLGRQLDHDVLAITVDVGEWLTEYPDGVIAGYATLPGNDKSYPLSIEMDGDNAVWTVREGDTAKAGYGKFQIALIGADGKKKHSAIADTIILASLSAKAGEAPPDPYKPWMDQVTQDVSGGVRFDKPQALTDEQKKQARDNIGVGAGGSGELGAGLPAVTPEDEGKVLTVIGGAWAAAQLPKYDGEYEVVPQAHGAVTLETAQKYMDANVTVTKIPYFETSNATGGETAYIASEVEIYGD